MSDGGPPSTVATTGCSKASSVLDLGCGEGVTLRAIGRKLRCRLSGMDYSESMLDIVAATFADELGLTADVRIGDVRNLPDLYAGETFDFVMSDRCLINLETEAQLRTVRDIAGLVRPGGLYLAMENFVEGQDQLNALRAQFGLPAIEVRCTAASSRKQTSDPLPLSLRPWRKSISPARTILLSA